MALADRGTTVLGLSSASSVKLALLSSYDTDPPTPVWSISTPPGPLLVIAAAEEADVYLQSDLTQTGPFSNSSTLRKYSSGSAVPDWTFDFPQQGLFLFPTTDVSRDEQTLMGLIQDEVAMSRVVHVFGPSLGTPTARFSLPSSHWGNSDLDLSSSGSIAAFVTPSVGSSVPARTHVVDLAAQSLIDSVLGKLPVGGD